MIWVIVCDRRTQKSLQWWAARQSIKLFSEAEKIRDDLLQESFTIRRSLETISTNNIELSATTTKECLKKLDQFHQSLSHLSNCLSPPDLPDSFPFAIYSILESWLTNHPRVSFNIDLPTTWSFEPVERSLIILSSIEELLKITIPEDLTEISVYLYLKSQENLAQLTVEITYPDIPTQYLYSSQQELNYLSHSFCFLTQGKFLSRIDERRTIYLLYWSITPNSIVF